MNSRQRQAGMSIPGMLVIAVMVGFFVMCAIRMVPHYFEYLSVREIISSAAREHNPGEQNLSGLRRQIATSLNTNQIYDITAKEIEVYRKDGETLIDANYEVRIPIMGRIDAVMKFDDLQFVAGNKLL